MDTQKYIKRNNNQAAKNFSAKLQSQEWMIDDLGNRIEKKTRIENEKDARAENGNNARAHYKAKF